MSTKSAVTPSADVPPTERRGCRLGFLSWFWSAGAWATLFLALLGWVCCVGLVLGVPNGIERWIQWCGTWVVDVGTFIIAFILSLFVFFFYIGGIMVGFGVAMASHALGLLSGTGTVLMPGASPWARLSGVFPLGAHVGGAIIGLYLLLFTGPNDPANAPVVDPVSSEVGAPVDVDDPEPASSSVPGPKPEPQREEAEPSE